MDIGTLTGTVAIEDQLSEALTLCTEKVKSFAEAFDGAVGVVVGGAVIATTAILGIAVSIDKLGEEGSKIIGVENAFDKLAESAGTTGDALRGGLMEGVKGTIDDMVLMQSTTRLLGSGMQLTADQTNLMGAAARELGKATGTDAANGLDIMSSALTTGRTRQLQMQIGLIDIQAGEQKFADSLGVTVDQLNAAGQLEGKRIAILDATQAYLDRLGESELSFAEKVKQGWTALDEWGDSLAKAVATSADVNKALDTIGAAISKAFGAESQNAMDLVVSGINAFSRGVTESVPYVVSFASGVKDAWNILVLISPLLETVAVGLAAYGTGLLLVTGYTSAANAITIAYTATMAALRVESIGLGAAMTASLGPIGLVAAAIASIFAAWKVGQLQEVSDTFEYLGLRIQGISPELAHLTIDSRNAADAAASHAKQIKVVSDAYEWQGPKLQDNTQYLKDNAAAVKAVNDALKELTSAGIGWQTTLDTIDGSVVEGIKYYLSAGVAQGTLATAYGLTAQQVKAVSISLEEDSAVLVANADFAKMAADRRAEVTRAMTSATNDLVIADMRAREADQAFADGALAAAEAEDKLNAAFMETIPAVQQVNGGVSAATNFMDGYRGSIKLTASSMEDLNHQLDLAYAKLALIGPLGQITGSGVGTMTGSGTGNVGTTWAQQLVPQPPHFAEGGTVVVGENGPERVALPYGSVVSPNAGGGTQVIQLVVDGRVLAQVMNDQNTRTTLQGRKFQ